MANAPTTPVEASSPELRRQLLATVAAYCNLADTVAQGIIAVALIFARVNPNEARAPPASNDQVLALVVLKLTFEVLTDIIVAVISERWNSGDDSRESLGDLWEKMSRIGRVCVGVLSAIVGAEMLTFHIGMMCPYPTQYLGLLSIGLCV